jgi:predicted MFS family arabinose efflux permease
LGEALVSDVVRPAAGSPAAAGTSPALLTPLRIANFRNLWLGQGISLVGDQFKFVALSWLVLSLTGRSAALGTLLMLQAVPRSIFMLAGGVVTDRFRPRTIMVLSDLLRACVAGTIAALAWTHQITMPHLYALALIFGTVHAFFYPAQSSMIPELVPPGTLRQANAISQLTNQIVFAAAPALAGFLIAAVGVAAGFAVDASSFVLSATFLLLIRPPARQANREARPWTQFVEGLRYVRGDPVILATVIVASLFFFGYSGATFVGLPVLARGPLAAGPAGLGVLFSASGAGALLGGLIGGMRSVRRRGITGNALIVAMGAVVGAVSFASNLPAAAALLFISGALMSWLGITFMTLLQLRTERTYMGRVMATMLFGIYGLYPFSYGLAGWISEAIGVRALFAAGGVMIAAAGMLGLSTPAMRRLD